jgi:hypothetical protein|tara:strand:+ start:8301 stop:8468 length:168 start_codon:yes stop_codon:yes gene_type:complete
MTKREDKEKMLDSICDPEELSGFTVLEEIEFTLYALQAELNRLQKLVFIYKQDKE